jgi:putative transposase
VGTRVAPSIKIEEALHRLLTEGLDDPGAMTELGRLGTQLAIQRGVEDEVAKFLVRGRYERTPEARGSRNGVRPRRVQTAEGEITVQVPQLRNTAEEFVSKIIPDSRRVIRTRPMEALIIGAYVRGLSDRDIESLIAETGLGLVSKSTVSEICKELRDRYKAFRARSLHDVELIALFLDAIYLPTRPSGDKEGVLVAWGYDVTGQRVLLDVCMGLRERKEDWLSLGRGLTVRGLRAPVQVRVDGNPGLNTAVGELWPTACRQRCAVHRLRNIDAKISKHDTAMHAEVKADYWAALDDATSPVDAEQRLRALVNKLEPKYPSAAAYLADDLPALTVHLNQPLHLRKRLRSTNLLERSLEEVRRRTKVIGRFPGETSCLSLCWAVLDIFIASSRGLGLTDLDHQRIAEVRAQRERMFDTRDMIA